MHGGGPDSERSQEGLAGLGTLQLASLPGRQLPHLLAVAVAGHLFGLMQAVAAQVHLERYMLLVAEGLISLAFVTRSHMLLMDIRMV